MICKDCCYFWKDENEEYPGCHFVDRCPGDKAPCEEEDWNDEE